MLWNLIGIIAWLLVLVLLIFCLRNIRYRHVKLLFDEKKNFTWKNFGITVAEVLVFFLALAAMTYTTFFRNVTKTSNPNVTVSQTIKPLVIQNQNGSSFIVKEAGSKSPISHYSFDVKNSHYQVASTNAVLATSLGNAEATGKSYNLNSKTIKKMDGKYQRAWVKIIRLRYKDNFVNGLGLHAGNIANQFVLLRLPDKTFVLSQS